MIPPDSTRAAEPSIQLRPTEDAIRDLHENWPQIVQEIREAEERAENARRVPRALLDLEITI